MIPPFSFQFIRRKTVCQGGNHNGFLRRGPGGGICGTMSVWGRQQMDDSANRASTQIVEPEKDASMSELIKYNEKLNEYI